MRKRKYKGEEVEKRGERGNVHCTRGKKIYFRKKGVGQIYIPVYKVK